MSKSNDFFIFEEKQEIIRLIVEQSRYRKIIPFIGSGISVSAGFPTISPIIQYLAKVLFSIQYGVYQDRFPLFNVTSKHENLGERYKQHPSEFLRDFGWPNIGQLEADLWDWLARYSKQYLKLKGKNQGISGLSPDLVEELFGNKKKVSIATRDQILAITQWTLRQELARHDEGTISGLEHQWLQWKNWQYKYEKKSEILELKPKLLCGDWEMLLDKLCEGDFGLVDTLFAEIEKGLQPAHAHRLMAFLQSKLGIPVVLTTNFDSLLERAFREEGFAPKIFDIHRDSELPDPALVQRQFSMLKLHGSAYGLRLGERLKLKMDFDLRNNILNYLPENALIMVLGFSGSERRIMQLLQSLIDVRDGISNPKMIWIQGPGSDNPLFLELMGRNYSNGVEEKRIIACKIKHADTFLQELFFEIASSHQATNKSYSSLPGRHHMTELALTLKPELYFNPNKRNELDLKRKPIQVFFADQNATRSGSWATLAGTAFTQLLHQSYRIIWIDLENHCTLESVIAEFFYRVQLLDPSAPDFNFSLSAVRGLGMPDEVQEKAMRNAANRIWETFKRGKYVLVLDSVESFGRPQLVHHGLPSFIGNNGDIEEFTDQIYLLKLFLKVLFSDSGDKGSGVEIFKDSYLVITVDKPRFRHPLTLFNSTYKIINDVIQYIKDSAKENDELISFYEQNGQTYSDLITSKTENKNNNVGKNGKKNQVSKNITQYDEPDSFLSKDWQSSSGITKDSQKFEHLSNQRALKRAKDVYFLLKLLRTKNCPLFDHSTESIQGVLSAFICMLGTFRRPRTIPLLRAMVDRWILRNFFDNELDEKSSDQVHIILSILIDFLTSEPDKQSQVRNKFMQEGNGRQLLNQLLLIDPSLFKIMLQKHEGGSIWMVREAQESAYEALTENLHFQAYFDQTLDNDDFVPNTGTILDGLTCISWHLHAARVYYVDLYLPTHDIQAFYEYIYHRCSALKTISFLIGLIEKHQAHWNSSVLQEEYKELSELNEKCILASGFNSSLVWYAYIVGVFSEDPIAPEGKTRGIDKSQERYSRHDDIKKIPKKGGLNYVLDSLISLRQNALGTLSMSLKRNKAAFRAYSPPEVVWSWSNQFLNSQLPQIIGERFYKNGKQALNDVSKKEVDEIKNYFYEMRLNALLAKLDFDGFIIEHGKDMGFDNDDSIGYVPRINDYLAKILADLKCINYSKSEWQILHNKYKKAVHLLRCIIHLNSDEANMFATKLISQLTLCKSIDPSENASKLKLLRDIYALKARSILNYWIIWQPLRRRPVSLSYNCSYEIYNGHIALLAEAEQKAIDYEDSLRVTCSSKEEEARNRSSAFVIRARALYLRKHFRQAHRFLDLASSDLVTDRPDHRINAAVLHILRAELLANSADSHYEECLQQIRNDNYNEVLSSIKKIERAEQELILAENLLESMSHQKFWLILLEFGIAQLSLEKLLFQMEQWYLKRPQSMSFYEKDDVQYLLMNGLLEQSMLDSISHLRTVLDLLPYVVTTWEETENMVKNYKGSYSPERLDYPALIKIERMTYSLLFDLYFVGANYANLIEKYFQSHEANVLSFETTPHYNKRWRQWCYSMRFHRIGGKIQNLLDDLNTPTSILNQISGKSLRRRIINDLAVVHSDDRVDQIWNFRRNDVDFNRSETSNY